MSTFGYQLPCHRYLDLSVLMLIYFIIKSRTRCIGRCNHDINGRILGAKCPLYLVSVPQKQIRLLCAPPVAFPFRISSCLASSAAEGKCLGSFSTPLCSFISSEPLTAAVSQNGLRIEAEGQWSQDNRNGNVCFLVWLHSTLNHNNLNSRVPNSKIPLKKTLSLSVPKTRLLFWFFFPSETNSSIFQSQNFHLETCRAPAELKILLLLILALLSCGGCKSNTFLEGQVYSFS